MFYKFLSEWQYSVFWFFLFLFVSVFREKKSQIFFVTAAFDSFSVVVCVFVIVCNCVNTLEFGRIISFNSLTVCCLLFSFYSCCLFQLFFFFKCTVLLLISFIYSFYQKMWLQSVRMSNTKLKWKLFNEASFCFVSQRNAFHFTRNKRILVKFLNNYHS